MPQETREWGHPLKSDNPIIFLHGLPGIKSGQNQDLATYINTETKRDILIQFGEGLSIRPGTFTFTKEYANKESLIKSMKAKNITLVGHSWGGYQALILAALYPDKIKRLILMSPLLGIMPRAEINTILDTLQKDHPEVRFAPRPQMLTDAESFNAAHPIEQIIARVPASTPTTFVQAKNDPVTPPQRAKGLLPLFKTKPEYVELDCDHNFLIHRPLLFAAMLKAVLRS